MSELDSEQDDFTTGQRRRRLIAALVTVAAIAAETDFERRLLRTLLGRG